MLRKLQMADAHGMLEWMHDENVVRDLKADFKRMTLDDCKRFILSSESVSQNLHYAVTNSEGAYLGTVSLKNINLDEKSAEFAIVISSKAMGKGYSKEAMEEILEIGFQKYKLNRIFWCVSIENKRAIKFYEKNGYEKIPPSLLKKPIGYTATQINTYVWFQIRKN